MSALKLFRYVALVHIGIGALLMLSFPVSVVSCLYRWGTEGKFDWAGLAVVMLFGVTGCIGFVLAQGGTRHRRQPTRKTATVLAVNTSVIAWVIILRCIQPPIRLGPDPVSAFVPIVVGYLIYRLLLKPMAVRAFPTTDVEAHAARANPHA